MGALAVTQEQQSTSSASPLEALRAEVLARLAPLIAERAPEFPLAQLQAALTRPPDSSKGDLALPVFPLAKALKGAPPAIAQSLGQALSADLTKTPGLVQRVEIQGPYLNFFAAPAGLLARLLTGALDGSFFAALHSPTRERVMVEFSQPNTHKVFHVGHLRNVCVGDALQRIFRARGHDVVAANYYGDFGIDVAKCLWWLTRENSSAPLAEAPPTDRGAWLGRAYANTTAHIEALEKDKEANGGQIQALFARLKGILEAIKAGDQNLQPLYALTRQWCLDEFAEVYGWLGVHFDTDFFESELEEPGQRIVDEFLERGVFELSQGAIICNLEAQKLGPALVRKTDGTSLYLTWDLVLARRKFDEFKVERSLYVVGAEQTYHFQQLFATLGRMGYERAKDCRHVAYELVMLPDGKMSSRKGRVITFDQVRGLLAQAIRERMQSGDQATRADWSQAQWDETIHRVAVACLRYGMLRVTNTTRVIFDIDTWTNLEGETGAYLLYSLARIAGIFRKGGQPDSQQLLAGLAHAAEFGAPAERELLAHLLRYGEVLALVERSLDPSHLASWLYDGAKVFSRFYHDCPVLKAEEPLRSARLALCRASELVLSHGLRALGIEPVEQM
jgi:arginyl-tRNA synthetase